MSKLLQDLVGTNPEAVRLLADLDVRLVSAGRAERSDSVGDASFLIVEEGFVMIRRAVTERRGVIICHAGPGALLQAPEPGETLDALIEGA